MYKLSHSFVSQTYVAVRFNLRITHVHRGLLLGTGPLVDPGFHGKLLIPLHNLTAYEYYLDTEKALIWVEFTKTTFGFIPTEPTASQQRHFTPFPIKNRNLTPDEYLFKARGGQPIISSNPGAIARAEQSAARAAGSVRRLVRWATGIGAVSIVVAVVALAALMYSSWTVMQNGNALAVAASAITKDQGIASEKLQNTQNDLDKLKTEIIHLREQVGQNGDALTVTSSAITKDQSVASEKLQSAKDDIGWLKAEVDRLRTQVDQLLAVRQNR